MYKITIKDYYFLRIVSKLITMNNYRKSTLNKVI